MSSAVRFVSSKFEELSKASSEVLVSLDVWGTEICDVEVVVSDVVVSVVPCEEIDVLESCPEVLAVLDVLDILDVVVSNVSDVCDVSDVSGTLEVESSVEVADIEVSVTAEVTV